MTLLLPITLAAGAAAALAWARLAERHRQWTLVMAERRRRRVQDALAALERDLWAATATGRVPDEGSYDQGPASLDIPPYALDPAPRRGIEVRVRP